LIDSHRTTKTTKRSAEKCSKKEAFGKQSDEKGHNIQEGIIIAHGRDVKRIERWSMVIVRGRGEEGVIIV